MFFKISFNAADEVLTQTMQVSQATNVTHVNCVTKADTKLFSHQM